MLIIAKNKIINMEHIPELFISRDEISIKYSMTSNSAIGHLCTFDSPTEARIAMENIGIQIKLHDIIFVPTSEEIKAEIVNKVSLPERHARSNGRKIKRHGGS